MDHRLHAHNFEMPSWASFHFPSFSLSLSFSVHFTSLTGSASMSLFRFFSFLLYAAEGFLNGLRESIGEAEK